MSTSVPHTPLGARPGAAVLAALACSGAALLAAPAAAAAPGDHGDVTVRSVGTPISTQRSEARVCAFYLAGADFDTVQEITWAIVPQGRNAQAGGLSGGISLAGGLGRTEELTLPDGVYKLTWNVEGAAGAGKNKVFTVDCATAKKKSTTAAGRPSAETDNEGRSEEEQAAPEEPAAARDQDADAATPPDEGETDSGAMDAAEAIPGADGPESSGTDRSLGSRAGADTEARIPSSDPAEAHTRTDAPPSGPVGAGGGGVADREDGAGGPSPVVVTGTLAAGAAGMAGLFLVRRARRRSHGAV
ncbi:hypothetical protein ACZ90_29740 [Streptomyces albus subsp. albus]|nr:hypothetical protein ACZ90_29740 [Streptomyces albus subsp. albus]